MAVLFAALPVFALQGGPKQPEYADFVSQSVPDMVDPLTGDFSYVIPLGDVPGPNGGFPLTLSYRAGISPAAEASWVGLGWTLNPGSIDRSVMGLPDDMMGEGALSFLYAYSKNEDWSVSLGVGAGPASVGISHYGSGASGINASMGLGEIMNVSLGEHNGALGVSAGVHTPWPVTRASLGVSAYQGQDASFNMGFDVGPSPMKLSFDASGSVGVSGVVNASTMNTANASGGTSSKVSTSATGIYVPFPNGMHVSAMFSESVQEWWQRQATETFNYGYLYQGGPPVAPGMGMVEPDLAAAASPTRGGSNQVPWVFDRKGATLEYSGRPLGFVSPANDAYAMRAEGLQGSFRPRAMMDHRLNIVVERNGDKPSENSKALIRDSSTLFNADSAEWAYGYCVSANGSYVYGNDTANADCATAGNVKSNFANDANRMVYHPQGSDGGRFRSHMDFLVSGSGSFMSLDSAEWDESRKKEPAYLPPEQIQAKVGDWAYGLRGGTAVEPILSDSGRGGSLEGFRVKRPDGSVYVFAQPVRVFFEGNYNTSDSIGGPVFVDQKAKAKDFFDATVDALIDLGGDALRYGPFVSYKWAWKIGEWGADALSDFFTGSESINNICKVNDSSNTNMTQMNWSYMMKTSPYATTWLLTEVRGADFFNPNPENLNPSVDSTYGFHVKLKYSEPEHYWWRFPFTPPGTPYDSLPNWKIPKAGLTPEECGGEQYASSFGLKEQVYLAEIETKTHRAVFNLNDPENEERLDGKGWSPDFGESLEDSAASRAIKSLTEFPVYVSAVLKATLVGDSATANYSGAMQIVETKSKKYKVEGIYLRTSLPADRIAAMTENSWAKIAVTNLAKVGKCPPMSGDLNTMQSSSTPCGNNDKGLLSSNSSLAFFDMDSIRVVSAAERRYGAIYVKFRSDSASANTFWRSVQMSQANEPGAFPETLMVGDPDQTPDYVPLVNWKPFVETFSPHPNQMRYLKGIDFFDKRTGEETPYRSLEFSYDYALQQGTLNSYPGDSVSAPEDYSLDKLGGKLTLREIRDVRRDSAGHETSEPPFRFGYNGEDATPLRTLDGASLAENVRASQNITDNWGYWNRNANETNHFVDQNFADYGAGAWSLNQIVEPTGAVTEIEYERDVHRGFDLAADSLFFPVEYEFDIGDSATDSSVVLYFPPLLWKKDCGDVRRGAWDVDTSTHSFAYADSIGVVAGAKLAFSLSGGVSKKVGTGAFRLFKRTRNRTVGVVGTATVDTVSVVESRLFAEMDSVVVPALRVVLGGVSPWTLRDALQKSAFAQYGKDFSVSNVKHKFGSINVFKPKSWIKDGGLRVKSLTRRDLGTVVSTRYDYGSGGETAQIPDSAFSMKSIGRALSDKMLSPVIGSSLPGRSGILGINDEEARFLPAPEVMYPRVRQRNVAGGKDPANGATEYLFITPESGIPREYLPDVDPILVFNVQWAMKKTVMPIRHACKIVLKAASDSVVLTAPVFTDEMNSFVFDSTALRELFGVDGLSLGDLDSIVFTLLAGHPDWASLDDTARFAIPKSAWCGDSCAAGVPFAEIDFSALLPLEEPFEMIQNDRMPPQYFLGAVKTQRNVPPVVKRQRWENADGTVRRKATEYHDYTAFVGRPIRTDFLRVRESDGAWIRVSSDSMLYAERPTSVDMRGVTGNDADFVSKNIGLEIEKWSVSRRLDCGSGHCNGEDWDPYRKLSTETETENYVHVRHPAFLVGTIHSTGFDNNLPVASNDGSRELRGASMNYLFSPFNLRPNLVATVPVADSAELGMKLALSTPAYLADPSLISENRSETPFREDAFLFRRPTSADSSRTAVPDPRTLSADSLYASWKSLLESMTIHPLSRTLYSSMVADRSGAPVADTPPLSIGAFEYAPRQGVSDSDFVPIAPQNNGNLLHGQPGSRTLWRGTWTNSVSPILAPAETENVYGVRSVAELSADGEIGAFYVNAAEDEVRTLAASGYWTDSSFQANRGQKWTVSGVPSPSPRDMRSMGVSGGEFSTLIRASTSADSLVVRWEATANGSNPHIDVTVGNSTVSLQIEGRGIVSGEQTVPYASFGMSPGNEATLHVSPRNAKLRFIRFHPSNARAATYLRDVRGNIVEIVDEGGATVYYEYNPLGELVAIRDGDGALLSEQALDRGAGGKR